jgi:DNA-binding transcriptional regulator YdaS (Cro superfamily)
MAKPLERAVRIAGGQSALARKLNEAIPGAKVTQGQVWRWLQTGHPPAHWTVPIEKVIEAKVTRYELRSDVFPPEESVA